MSLFVFFISLLIVAQHVSGNHVPIIRSWRLCGFITSCWYVPWLQGGSQVRLACDNYIIIIFIILYIIIIFKHLTSVFLTDIYKTTLTISTTLVLYLYMEIRKIKWMNEWKVRTNAYIFTSAATAHTNTRL